MQAVIQESMLNKRIKFLGLEAETFQEERFLGMLVEAICRGNGEVVVTHGPHEMRFVGSNLEDGE